MIGEPATGKGAINATEMVEDGKRGNWGRFFFYRIFLARTPDIWEIAVSQQSTYRPVPPWVGSPKARYTPPGLFFSNEEEPEEVTAQRGVLFSCHAEQSEASPRAVLRFLAQG